MRFLSAQYINIDCGGQWLDWERDVIILVASEIRIV